MRNTNDINGPMWEFTDATMGELEEMLELLPSVEGYDLNILLRWVANDYGYYSQGYETGTRWLIESLKRERDQR